MVRLVAGPRVTGSVCLPPPPSGVTVDLLTEAYSLMTTEQLEEHGLIQLTEYQRVLQLTRSESPDAQQKISGTGPGGASSRRPQVRDRVGRGMGGPVEHLRYGTGG